MMKRFLVPLVLLVLAACAQAPTPGDNALTDLAPMALSSSQYDTATGLAKHSSGVYVSGFTRSNLYSTNLGGLDMFLSKHDTNGAFLWGRQIASQRDDTAQSVASDGSDNAYLVGTTEGVFGRTYGLKDVYLRKYSSSGGYLWGHQFGTPDNDGPADVATYGNSAIYVVGYTYGSLAGSSGSCDAFIRKFNTDGSVAWTRQFGTAQFDYATSVAVDGSGNAYVVGATIGSLGAANGGYRDMFIRKYDGSGNAVWTKQRHYSNHDEARAVAVTGSDVYLVGRFDSPNPDMQIDVRVVKYNTSGTLVWDRSYGSFSHDTANDVSADSTGVVFAGYEHRPYTPSDGFVYKLNSDGSFLWHQRQASLTSSQSSPNYEYPADEGTNAVLIRASGEVYAAGYTDGKIGGTRHGSIDAFLRRINGTTGATVWTDQ